MELLQSKTGANLMKAFAGESQARNRYDFAASLCKTQKLTVLQQLFAFTAKQEQQHAKIFFDFLKPCMDEDVEITGTFPTESAVEAQALLRSAHHNEMQEFEFVYPQFAQEAKDEGFPIIAAAFTNIAAIEKTHADRFIRAAKVMADSQLFEGEASETFVCLNCGHVHPGGKAPQQCPVCHHDQGYFVRATLKPFLG